MSTFYWRLVTVLSFLFFAFIVTLSAFTIKLTRDIHNNNEIDHRILDFVEIGNYVFISFLGIALILSIVSLPWVVRFSKKRSDIESTGLKKALSR